MDCDDYRKSIHYHALSMSFFKKLHDKGDISDGLYEYIEIRLALKYGILPKSVLRDNFQLILIVCCIINTCSLLRLLF